MFDEFYRALLRPTDQVPITGESFGDYLQNYYRALGDSFGASAQDFRDFQRDQRRSVNEMATRWQTGQPLAPQRVNWGQSALRGVLGALFEMWQANGADQGLLPSVRDPQFDPGAVGRRLAEYGSGPFGDVGMGSPYGPQGARGSSPFPGWQYWQLMGGR